MKNWKRLFSCVLIVCMLVSLSPAVFAADDSSEPVQIADGESVTVGNVTVTEGGDAVSALASEGESTTLTVEGDVKQTSEDWVYPVNVYADEENASATVNVTGSVVAEGEGGSIVYVGVDGGDATVIDLPKIGITGNSHFMFQELNNQEIADHIEAWLNERGLG